MKIGKDRKRERDPDGYLFVPGDPVQIYIVDERRIGHLVRGRVIDRTVRAGVGRHWGSTWEERLYLVVFENEALEPIWKEETALLYDAEKAEQELIDADFADLDRRPPGGIFVALVIVAAIYGLAFLIFDLLTE